ncbi:YfiR family protein [Ramlibacter henchirensis]|uniref:YfiR family protein n=1 Tax=Ramlibacter henchirensis TaxID=204072 RepID=A0A4Z0BR79_9BURK|nr:YfiR family protein [Ramlibacter henchirensis]TFZ00525.1 YfiR family protein [Ramlibacter henchirensis]
MSARPHMRLPPPWRLWLLLACAWHGLLYAAAPAPAAAPGESVLKAAFLYRIAGLVEWPPGTFERQDDPLVVAVAGHEAVAAELEQIAAGRTLDGRPIVVRRVREGEPIAGAHVLMIGATGETRVRELAASATGPVLVVTEQENGHRLGGILNFTSDGDRVRFTASLPVADARGVRLSARLLAVAQSVEGRSR